MKILASRLMLSMMLLRFGASHASALEILTDVPNTLSESESIAADHLWPENPSTHSALGFVISECALPHDDDERTAEEPEIPFRGEIRDEEGLDGRPRSFGGSSFHVASARDRSTKSVSRSQERIPYVTSTSEKTELIVESMTPPYLLVSEIVSIPKGIHWRSIVSDDVSRFLSTDQSDPEPKWTLMGIEVKPHRKKNRSRFRPFW